MAPLLLPLTLLGEALAGPCPATAGELYNDAGVALAAWDAVDSAGFSAARDEVLEAAGCLTQTVDPELATEVHLVEALDAYTRRRNAEALSALRGLPEGRVEQMAVLPTPFLELSDEARRLGPGLEEPIETVEGVTFFVDGRPGAPRPMARSAMVQAAEDDSGEVLWSALLQPGQGLPQLPEPEASAPTLVLEAPPREREPAKALLISGGATAVVAGGLWAGAGVGLMRFRQLEEQVAGGQELSAEQREESEALARRTNRLGYGAQAVTGLSAALLVTGVVVRF